MRLKKENKNDTANGRQKKKQERNMNKQELGQQNKNVEIYHIQ